MNKSVSGHMLANEHRGSISILYMSVTVFCSVAVMGPEVTGGVNRCPFKTALTVPQQHNLQALLEKSSSRRTVNFPLCGALEVSSIIVKSIEKVAMFVRVTPHMAG